LRRTPRSKFKNLLQSIAKSFGLFGSLVAIVSHVNKDRRQETNRRCDFRVPESHSIPNGYLPPSRSLFPCRNIRGTHAIRVAHLERLRKPRAASPCSSPPPSSVVLASLHRDVQRTLTPQSAEFGLYKHPTKLAWVTERQDLATLLGNVQTRLKTYGLEDYVPPKGLVGIVGG